MLQRFANSSWSIWLWTLVGLFVLLAWLQWHSRAQVGFVSKAMGDRLIRRPAGWLPWATLAVWFLSCLCLLLGWMRPQSDGGFELRPQVGAQIMVCLDVSRSMLAEDVAPNRLQRAKADLTDLLPYLRGDQVGMIAFAGTATVVSPMTTDFGFLRLLLENLGPHSVGRGGTQLEVPLRVAMDGFSPAGDVSRIVLLITDGEDHDSFPLAAAEEAGKRGIRIITMGFGSEAGSTIEYTDSQDGIRKIVRDENDQPVTSRLDGNTLRDIALKTDGAYIPVRTGTIDLKSIYDQHIAPLLRGQLQAGQVKVQNELFQWFVGAGLLLFYVAAGMQGRRPIERPATRVVAWFIGMLIAVGACGSVHAMTSVDPTQTSSVDTKEDAKETIVPSETSQSKQTDGKKEAKESPRVVYNRGRALLDSDAQQSEKLLQDAVDRAGNDGTLRFYGYYNLGWLATHQAEREYTNDQLEKALEQLQRAADRFQQALRIRPEDKDARHNLEIVYLRATQIQDAMDRKKQESLPDQLEQLLTKQRELIQQQAGFLQEAATGDPTEASEQEPIVRQYRQLATRQRLVRSDLEALSQQFADLAHRLQEEAGSSRTPATIPSVPSPSGQAPTSGQASTTEDSAEENRQLAAQLKRSEPHLQAAIQRMGQSRRDLRLRNGQRAFRRASHALDAMKQARDQLRSPGDRLQLLLSDAMSLLRLTTLRDATRQADNDKASEGPPWLSGPLLQESQATTLARTQELRQSLPLDDNAMAPEAATKNDPGVDWNDVGSILGRAVDYFRESGIALEKEEWTESVNAQSKGVQALADAADRLLDLKGLLEKIHSQEFVLQHMLESVIQASADQTSTDHRQPMQLDATVQQSRVLQSENHERMKRLQQKIVDEQSRVESEGRETSKGNAPDSDTTVPPNSQIEQEMQRFAIARKLADQASIQMSDALQKLSEPLKNDSQKAVVDGEQAAQPAGNSIVEDVKATVKTLNELRRLFFSIVEHLAEAAEKQATLRDETETLKSEMDQEKLQNELGSRQFRQQELAELTDQLGIALHDMQTSDKQSPVDDPGASIQGNGAHGAASQLTAPGAEDKKIVEAGEYVKIAGQAMRQTVSSMEAKPVELPAIGKLQDVALEHLNKAIQTLQPNSPQPQKDPQESDQNQPPDEKPDESPTNDSGKTDNQKDEPPSELNMALQELLQRVRDRDAKRKGNKMRRGVGRESVEKDW